MTRSMAWGLLALPLLAAGCIDDVAVPPRPPTLDEGFDGLTTRRAQIELTGTKPAETAVLNKTEIVVPIDDQDTWSFVLDLLPGENQVSLRTQTRNGRLSPGFVRALITFEPDFPAQPTLDPPESPTNQLSQTLRGTKQAGTALVLAELAEDGSVLTESTIVPLDGETQWSHALALRDQDGTFRFSLTAQDEGEQRGEPLEFTIVLDRAPPFIAMRYPEQDETDVPVNSLVSIGMDGPLRIVLDLIDPELVVL